MTTTNTSEMVPMTKVASKLKQTGPGTYAAVLAPGHMSPQTTTYKEALRDQK